MKSCDIDKFMIFVIAGRRVLTHSLRREVEIGYCEHDFELLDMTSLQPFSSVICSKSESSGMIVYCVLMKWNVLF